MQTAYTEMLIEIKIGTRLVTIAVIIITLNPLVGTDNYSTTLNNMKLVHWPLMGGLLHLVQQGPRPPSPLLAVLNVTAHPSKASVPITVLLYGPLVCSLMCPIKG